MDHYHQLCRRQLVCATVAWRRRLAEEVPATADAVLLHKT